MDQPYAHSDWAFVNPSDANVDLDYSFTLQVSTVGKVKAFPQIYTLVVGCVGNYVIWDHSA